MCYKTTTRNIRSKGQPLDNMAETIVLDKEASSGNITKRIVQESDSLKRNYIWQQNNAAWLSSIKFPITRFHSNKYRLSKPPLFVQVESYFDGYLVADEDVDRHGIGSTIPDALYDYEQALLYYFESLNKHYPKLSPRLRRDFEFLNKVIVKV